MAKVSQQRRPVKKTGNSRPAKGRSVLDRIRPVEAPTDGLKMSLYGMSGAGKTTFLSSWPKPLLIVDCNGGMMSVHDVKGVDTIAVEKPEDLVEVCRIQREEERWKTIGLDHASYYQDLLIAQLLGMEEGLTQLSWGTMTQQQWGSVAQKMKERLRELLQLTCNVVIVAQQREFNTDTDSELLMPYVSSALTPSVVGYLGPAVDYIAQAFIREHAVKRKVTLKSGKTMTKSEPVIQYCLRTGPHAVYSTKFRGPKSRKIPDVIVDPTYDKMMELIVGK